jgi:hypothetical protein
VAGRFISDRILAVQAPGPAACGRSAALAEDRVYVLNRPLVVQVVHHITHDSFVCYGLR